MGLEGVSKRQVARLCAEIDGLVGNSLAQPIKGDCTLPVVRRWLHEGG